MQSHWGEAVQLLSSDEEAPPQRQSRDEEQTPEKGGTLQATVPDGDSGAASSTAPFTRFATPSHEGRTEGGPLDMARRRRSFTSPSSLDNDD